MRFVSGLVFVLFLIGLWAQPARAQSRELPLPVLEDFLGDADYWGAELSPEGRYVAGVRQTPKGPIVLTVGLEDPVNSKGLINTQPFYPLWVDWATEDRVIIRLRGYVDYGVRKMTFLTLEDIKKGNYKNFPVPIDRLFAVDRDGKNSLVLLSDKRDFKASLNNANVVSFLRKDPDHIMMAARLNGDLDLFKVNIRSGEYERVAVGTDRTFAWYVDRNGEPAFRYNTNLRGTMLYIFAREDREGGKVKWKQIRTIRLNKDNENREAATEFSPLFPGPTETTYYVAARPDGEQTTGIYLYDFEKDEFLETIKKDPTFDISRAFFDQDSGEYLGVAYFRNRLTLEFRDSVIQSNLNGLQEFFGETTNISPVQTARQGRIWLLKTFGPTDPGSYYTYDLDRAYVEPVGLNFFRLSEKSLSDSLVIDYAARDGLPLTGYLTRPANLPEGAKPPLIMLPHGGPEVRDYLTFDFEVQLLTAYGYQVFQPNFRGSSGYGKDFADKGRRQWGKAMQTDIDDGLQALIDAGHVDAGNACIFGTSYGGYAAMAALTLTPDAYRCVIAKAGPSDLIEMLKWERKEEGKTSEAYQYWVDHIGDPDNDKDAIKAVSPALLADRAVAPLLLMHGDEDGVVPIEQSEIMEKAMTDAGKHVQFVRLTGSGHSYYGEGQEEKMMVELLAFLRKHLPSERNKDVPADTK